MNDARARVVPLTKKKVKIVNKFTKEEAEFSVSQNGWDISPISDLKIVGKQDVSKYESKIPDKPIKKRVRRNEQPATDAPANQEPVAGQAAEGETK